MYQRPAVPRSIGGVLDDTFQLYKASFASCWPPMVIIAVVGAASGFYRFSTVPPVAPGAGLRELLMQFQATPRGYLAVSVLVMALDLVLYAMLIVNIVTVSRGETPSFAASLAIALRRAPALLLATIIFVIAVAIGTVLLVVPGIYVWNRLQLFVVPLVTGPEGPVTSLSTSWRLVGGHWWRTATVVSIMFAILWVLDIALVALGAFVAVLAHGGASNLVQSAGSFVLGSIVISAIVGIFTTPLLMTVFVTAYQDLLLRHRRPT
jgi:hypothetical protein